MGSVAVGECDEWVSGGDLGGCYGYEDVDNIWDHFAIVFCSYLILFVPE